MQTSHKFTQFVLLSLFLLGALVSASAQEAYVSDQQPGWMLVYPYYTSASANVKEDSYITITNSSSTRTAAVHMFFLDGKSCAQADMFICLTPNASQAFKASELDPDNTGYIIAMVINNVGLPDITTPASILIGNAFVTIPISGIQGNYGAEAFGSAGAISSVLTGGGSTAEVMFRAPNRFAVEVQSPLTAPNQRIVTVGLSGDMNGTVTGAGQTSAGQIINGNEKPSGSFSSWIPEGCQSFASLTSGSPRAPGGVNSIIPAGQVGTLKFNTTAAVGLLFIPNNSSSRSGIRGLHKLGTAIVTLSLSVFSPGC